MGFFLPGRSAECVTEREGDPGRLQSQAVCTSAVVAKLGLRLSLARLKRSRSGGGGLPEERAGGFLTGGSECLCPGPGPGAAAHLLGQVRVIVPPNRPRRALEPSCR